MPAQSAKKVGCVSLRINLSRVLKRVIVSMAAVHEILIFHFAGEAMEVIKPAFGRCVG